MTRQFDVLIIGAGVIGASMAGLLLARRLCAPGSVAIIAERLAPPRAASRPQDVAQDDWDLRVFAVSRASQRLLKICGSWKSLAPGKFAAYDRMCVWDATGEPGGSGSLTFDCAEVGEPNLGFIVEGSALQDACLRVAGSAGAVLIEAALEAVQADETDGVRVRLADGREMGARLLIAADGTQSKTRELLGIQTAGHAYQQDALVAHVQTQRPHLNTAWQRFLPRGPLAFLPLSDGRSSIVWSTSRAQAAELRGLDATAFGTRLTEASGQVLGACELTTPVVSFPLKLQYALDYVRPRAVLLGDAAHVVHPLAGQGMNLGLLDCAVLADALASVGAAVGGGEYRLLRSYERRRRSENLLTAAALDGLERLFADGGGVMSRLRAAGLGTVNRMPFVKRRMVERALGLQGDLPAFLAGEAGAAADAL